MAEGGESESGMSSEMIATTVNARSLECPICLDKLRGPKSLPCLHSFCEECLAAYINKETEDKSINVFPCPICRTAISPVDPTEAADVWAGQFPTNSLIMELSETKKEHSCQPCKNKGNSKSRAEFWCNEMTTFFCSDCKTSLHDIIHVKCDIMTVSNMKEYTATKYPRCQKHQKKTDLYCEDHNTLACSKCIVIDHRKCDIVLTAADYCDKLNDGSKFGELKTCVSEGISKLQTWIKDTKKHVETITTDRDQILSDLADLRQKVIAKFDEIQGDLIKDLTEVYNEQKTKAEKLSQRCESMKMSMTTTQQLAETTSRSADPTRKITVYLRGKAEVESCGSLLQDVETSYEPISIKYESTDVKDLKFDIGNIVVVQVTLGQFGNAT
ncbi:E3 ubiquitin-protein ligase Midline-1-like [Mizuhopecten yessoensis]|uniref:E3 ubiquitin-protein ligase Midline-1-like n=1 Tax=Mizuhopecten yessoensis TaxID=6573 RepID=UPI000B45AAC2|nr:E3 ubiquitin-protein ligase Midline-1-like [Mizuhopecten yessoensis]